MPIFKEQQVLNYTVKQIYDVIIDIEDYPLFVPWCSGARIVEKKKNQMMADLNVSFAVLKEKYRSVVLFEKPKMYNNSKRALITTKMVDGPLYNIDTRWEISSCNNDYDCGDDNNIANHHDNGNESVLILYINFEFNNKLLASVANIWFEKACNKIKDAFLLRMEELYDVPLL